MALMAVGSALWTVLHERGLVSKNCPKCSNQPSGASSLHMEASLASLGSEALRTWPQRAQGQVTVWGPAG